MAQSLVEQMETPTLPKGQLDLSHMPYNPDHYWIKVTDTHNNLLYQSKITRFTDIPLSSDKTTYMIEKHIPRSKIWLGQDDHDDVMFRVMIIPTQLNNLSVMVYIAKPIEDLEEELLALFQYIAVSLAICTLIIILISYQLAGKILAPVSAISRMAKEISEKSLHKQIPLSRNKDELYDLSVSLNTMLNRLHSSFKQQKEFIGNASHELKSPITLLMLAQEEMLINDNLPPSSISSLTRQLDTTRRMSHLVRNLLDLSRLEQKETLNKQTVDITTLINQILINYSELFEAKHICVQNNISENLILQGDKEKLFRLLINLVDNSIRYNFEENGIILFEGRRTNSSLFIEISNTAQPIPQEDLDRIFEQFYRVEKSRSINHGGSGLGLAIAKRIVDLHNGSICITNEPDNLIKTWVTFDLNI